MSLNPKGFLKKDLDRAVRLHDCISYYLTRADVLMGKGQFHEMKENLKKVISMADHLETLKNDKLLNDLMQEVEKQKRAERGLKENDQQKIVDKILSWKR